MDEGFTSYASSECMDYLFTGGGIPGDHSNAYEGYLEIVRDGKEEALDTHADHFNTNRAFGVASYNKGEVYLAQLEYVIGRDAFDRGMLKYFDTWKFKHPTDEDFLRVMETESGMVLDWYNEYFVHTTKTIDYAVTQVVGGGGKTGIALTRKGEMPMPVEMELTLRDGNKVLYYVPLDLMRGEKPKGNYTGTREVLTDWKWVDVDYTVIVNYPIEQIASITIDPERKVADTDRSNQELQIQSGIDFMLDKR
jgi:aminopeptidase N